MKYVLATPVFQTYLKTLWYTPKLCLCFYSVQNDINSLFHFGQMAAILDFIHNALSKVLSYYIIMPGITEARMLDTKIKFHLVQMAAILDFVIFLCLKKKIILGFLANFVQYRLLSPQKILVLLSVRYRLS